MEDSKPIHRLSNQICFPLYAASRKIIQAYREPLDKLGLTYPQYLVLMLLWEKDGQLVSEIGHTLYLDSGTLTPLLKRMQAANLVTRERDTSDERKVIISLTAKGKSLEEAGKQISADMICLLQDMQPNNMRALKNQLNDLINLLN